jgi:predicted amidohydrolase
VTLLDEPSAFLRVAAVQAASVPADVAANAEAAAGFVARADQAGADLVVFPELYLPAYHPPALNKEPTGCDVTVDAEGHISDVRLDPLREMAQRHRINVLIGASVRSGGGRYIATVLVDTMGSARDVYHKQHLCGEHERALFSAGDRGSTVIINGWRLGMGVCYDATFPEHARAAATAGCHAYVSGGAFLCGGEQRCDLYHAARALDNTFYVVFSGAINGPKPWTFCGRSAVYDPQGRAIDRAPSDDSGFAVADLEAQQLAETRRAHSMLADVRADLGERDTVTVGK